MVKSKQTKYSGFVKLGVWWAERYRYYYEFRTLVYFAKHEYQFHQLVADNIIYS